MTMLHRHSARRPTLLSIEPLEDRRLLALEPHAVPYVESFEGGEESLSAWEFPSGPSGAVTVTEEYAPHGGTRHLRFPETGGAPIFWTATVALDLSTVADDPLILDFWLRGDNTERFTRFILDVSGDGLSYRTAYEQRADESTYNHFFFDFAQVLAQKGIALDEDVFVRFGFAYYIDSPGAFIDDVRVTNEAVFGDLSLTSPSAEVAEGGSQVTATLSRSGDVTAPVSVTITPSVGNELVFPSDVTIPAGASLIDFPVSARNDGEVDGLQSVVLTASALGARSGSLSLNAIDDDTPQRRTIGGAFSGMLSPGEYIVISNLEVPKSSSLTIAPGSVLRFEPGKAVRADGELKVEGTSESPIVFTSAAQSPSAGDWGGVFLGEGASSFDHAEIAYAREGIRVVSSATIKNSDIHHHSEYGIRFDSAGGLVEGSRIHDNRFSGIYVVARASGFESVTSNPLIIDNAIVDNGESGVSLDAGGSGCFCIPARVGVVTGEVSRNIISRNRMGIGGGSNSGGGGNTNRGFLGTIIANNLVQNNTEDGIRLHASGFARLAPIVVNNTIVGNGGDGLRHNRPFTIYNNILAGNAGGLVYEGTFEPGDTDGNGVIELDDLNNVRNHFGEGVKGGPPVAGDTYPFDGVVDLSDLNAVRNHFGKAAAGLDTAGNLLWTNAQGDWRGYTFNYGALTKKNPNGTPADAQMNITVDPKFKSVGDFHLGADSPAIDSGVPSTAVPTDDFDGDLRDEFPDIGYDESTVGAIPMQIARGQQYVAVSEIKWDGRIDAFARVVDLLLESRSDEPARRARGRRR